MCYSFDNEEKTSLLFFAQLHKEAGENTRERVEGQWQLMRMGLLEKASHAPHLGGV